MTASPSSGRPNVLLVVLDSVRARNTSLHGYDRETTPFLEAFADRATTYAQARAPGTESVSSHASMFTGYHVREHGLTDRRDRLRAGGTAWEALADAGYDTGVFSNNPFLTELPVGLREAFGTVAGRERELPYPDGVNPKNFVIDAGEGVGKYVDFLRAAAGSDAPLGSLANGLSFKLSGPRQRYLPRAFRSDSSAERYADLFLDWQAEREGPWAACVNFMDAHFPYQPGPENRWGDDDLLRLQSAVGDGDQAWEFVGGRRPWRERESLVDLYDGAVRRMDAQVRRLVGTLERRGALSDALVVVTADHGEGFGEADPVRPDVRAVGHGNGGLHEALVHVPLLVRWPDGVADAARGAAVDAPATLTGFADAVRRTTGLDEARAGPATGEDGCGGGSDHGEDATAAADAGDPFLAPPVVASTDGVDPDTEANAREYCDAATMAPLTTPADAVYEATAGDGAGEDDEGVTGVTKHVRWGDVAARVALSGTGDGEVVAESDDGRVEATLAALRDVDVLAGGTDEVSDEVRSRLEELGYA
jgi:arylsulfatase